MADEPHLTIPVLSSGDIRYILTMLAFISISGVIIAFLMNAGSISECDRRAANTTEWCNAALQDASRALGSCQAILAEPGTRLNLTVMGCNDAEQDGGAIDG